jgi:hypothetical protein
MMHSATAVAAVAHLPRCCRGCCCNADEKVKAAKQQLADALADSDTAWTNYINEYGGGSVLNLIAGPKTRHLPEPVRADTYKRNFKAALHVMDKLNKDAKAEGYDAVAYGINSHAHLDEDDYVALRATGLLSAPLPAAVRRARRAGPRPAVPPPPPAAVSAPGTVCSYSTGQVNANLPGAAASVDWVAKGFVTGIRDQGNCGSCGAFAATVVTEWVLMQNYKSYNNINTDLSEDDLMQCERGYCS